MEAAGKRPHARTVPSPSPSAGSMTLLVVTSIYRKREGGQRPPGTMHLHHHLLQPLAQSSWYRRANISNSMDLRK